jgi:hypothetical protein
MDDTTNKEQNYTARDHARDFLMSIDPRGSIQEIGKLLLEAARKDKSIADKFNTIQKKMGEGKPIIGLEHSVMFERIKSRQSILDIPTAPEWLRPLLVVGYLRAKQSVKNSKTAKLLNDPKASLDKVIKLADNLEPEFLGELLVKTAIRAREDSKFAKTLRDGAAEFRNLVGDLYTDEAKNPGVTAKANNGGSGTCTACRVDPDGTTTCGPIPCWVIVVIIIIIIVGK